MLLTLTDDDKKHCVSVGMLAPPDSIDIPEEEYKQHLTAWKRSLPHSTEDQLRHKIIAHFLHAHRATVGGLPVGSPEVTTNSVAATHLASFTEQMDVFRRETGGLLDCAKDELKEVLCDTLGKIHETSDANSAEQAEAMKTHLSFRFAELREKLKEERKSLSTTISESSTAIVCELAEQSAASDRNWGILAGLLNKGLRLLKWLGISIAVLLALLIASILFSAKAHAQNRPCSSSAAAPSWVDGNLVFLSCDNSGNLRVTFSASGLTITGNVTVVQPTAANLNATVVFGAPQHVICDGGTCGGASAFADNSAFTTGVSAINPVGAIVDEAAPHAVTDGNAGAPRMSTNRNLYGTIRDAAGNERGANVNASKQLSVSVDNTPTVTGAGGTFPVTGTFWQATQPVSGTFWQATQPVSGTFFQATQPVSVADAADVTLGAKADAKSTATDTTAISAMQVLKEISAMEQAPASRAVTNTGTFATQSAITAASGSVSSGAIASGAVASGAIASGAVASGAVASGAYAVGSISDGAQVTLGAKADAKASTTDATPITAMQVLKELSFLLQGNGSLAANQSTNVAQINGVTPLMGNGGTGTGSQRVTVASDNTAFQVKVLGNAGGAVDAAMAAAVPANGIQMAGRGSGAAGAPVMTAPVVCDNWAVVNLASTTSTKIITKATSKNVYICTINIVSAAANNVALIAGTKVTNECDTSTAGLAGGTTAATGWNFAANGGIAQGTGVGAIAATASTGLDVCLLASGSGQVSGNISYAQF